ncbi:adenosylcobinamide amidohydrolase [Methanosphaera sp. WGK6]|uniref:adenosylcobinamide amidohydrolase n=1 Tax=Methanosphaera sp. WGK6 TaxID=1561964 RepID=UPI00084C340E|nr:adenosylcobinamide amidohydrolase [Methanosphaera sp. WGK6]
MTYIYSEIVYSNDLFDLIKRDAALIIKFKVNNNLVISSWLNGGYQENMKYVVNQTLEGSDYNEIASMDYKTFQSKCMEKLELNPLKSTGLFTSACMDNYAISTYTFNKLTVTSIVTAGADKNGIKAGDPASFYEYDNKYSSIGTINVITIINANLEPGALITASITVTEAKTSVLEDLKLESQFSTHIATGTGTDGICIVSNKSSKNHIENAGKHSKLGELIAKSVQDATRKALYYQTAMNTEYQKTVINRLTRFNIDFDDFYNKTSNITKTDYVSLLYPYINETRNIAWVSMVVNLIDEYQTNLLEFKDIIEPIKEIISTFTGISYDINIKSIKDIMDYMINAINDYLIKKG